MRPKKNCMLNCPNSVYSQLIQCPGISQLTSISVCPHTATIFPIFGQSMQNASKMIFAERKPEENPKNNNDKTNSPRLIYRSYFLSGYASPVRLHNPLSSALPSTHPHINAVRKCHTFHLIFQQPTAPVHPSKSCMLWVRSPLYKLL